MQKYHRLKDLREDMDKNQTEIAEIIGTTQSYYAQYERGVRDIPFERAIALAVYYNVSLDYIAGLTNEKRPLYKQSHLFGSISNGKTQTALQLQEILAEKLTEKD